MLMDMRVSAVQMWLSIIVFSFFQGLVCYEDISAFNLGILQDGEFCIAG